MSRNARDKMHAQSKRPAKFKRKPRCCNFKVTVCIRVIFWVTIRVIVYVEEDTL